MTQLDIAGLTLREIERPRCQIPVQIRGTRTTIPRRLYILRAASKFAAPTEIRGKATFKASGRTIEARGRTIEARGRTIEGLCTKVPG